MVPFDQFLEAWNRPAMRPGASRGKQAIETTSTADSSSPRALAENVSGSLKSGLKPSRPIGMMEDAQRRIRFVSAGRPRREFDGAALPVRRRPWDRGWLYC